MVIYGEFLFLENAVSGAVILLLTGKLCGCSSSLRIAAGSIMCGGYAFILLADIGWLWALFSKILFSAAIISVAFGIGTWKHLLKRTAVFYIISFLMGGITIALMYMFDLPGMASNGSIYMYGIKYLQILAGVLLTLAAGLWLSGYIKERRHMEDVIVEAIIRAGSAELILTALVDTGNSLKDPLSGHPAAVISSSAGRKLTDELGDAACERLRVIPFCTVGGKGVMHGIRPDCIEAGDVRIDKVVLAIADCEFEPWKGTLKYDMLLHQQLFEGRI